MLVFLVIFTMTCTAVGLILLVIYMAKSTTTDAVPSAALSNIRQCVLLTSALEHGLIAIYIDVIMYEAVVLALTLYGALRYSRVPQTRKSKLLDVLWIDGIIYFVFMFVLGVFNVALSIQVLIISSMGPPARVRGAQMQTVFHSILSARIVLHITAVLKQDPVDSRSTTLVKHEHPTTIGSADSDWSNVLEIVPEEGTANGRLV